MNLAQRTSLIDSSGIRKVFDLAATLKDPCNLSIGLPDYDVPDPVKDAAIEAIRAGKNRYTLTAGLPLLRERILQLYKDRGTPMEAALIASGTSGGLFLCFLALLDPGDEIMITDPYFVMYRHLPAFIGAVPKYIDTYPDFRLRREALEAAWSPKCKMMVINSPNNPTGVVYSEEELRMAARFAEEKGLIVLTDEIYEHHCYDGQMETIAHFTDPARTIILSGLSKNVAMTGWRLGWVAAPKALINSMSDIQQYSFVCAPSMAQEAAFAGLDYEMTEIRALFKKRRDVIYNGLVERGYEVAKPGGAFYIFPKAPIESGEEFVKLAIKNSLLVVPGNVFSTRNSHFRISFAASTEQLERGLEILEGLLQKV